MTRGERGERDSSAMPPPAYSTGTNARLSASANVRGDSTGRGEMRPPEIPRANSRQNTAQPPLHSSTRQDNNNTTDTPRPSASIDPDSLFVPADDDQQWDEQNYGDEDEDMLGWDASVDQVCPRMPSFQ